MTKSVPKPTTRRACLPNRKPGYATLPGIGSRICGAITTGGTTYYVHDAFSPNGSVIKQTNAAGDVIRHTEYNAFGQVLGESTTGPDIPNRFGYHTNWLTMPDSNGGVLASPTRTYVAHLGIFLQRDPLFYDLQVGQAVRGRNAITASETYRALIRHPVGYVDGSSLHQGHFAMRRGTDPMGLGFLDYVSEVFQGLTHKNKDYNTGIPNSLILLTDEAYDDLIGEEVDAAIEKVKQEVPTNKQVIEAWKELYGDQAWSLTVLGGEGTFIFGAGIVSGTATKLSGEQKTCMISANCASVGWQAGVGVAVTQALVASKAKCCLDLKGAEPKWVQVQFQAGGKVGGQIWVNRIGVSGGTGIGSPAEAKFVACKITSSVEISPL